MPSMIGEIPSAMMGSFTRIIGRLMTSSSYNSAKRGVDSFSGMRLADPSPTRPLAFLDVATTWLFLGNHDVMVQLDFGALFIDSFVRLDASISLKKEGNERPCKKTRYSSLVPWRYTLTRLLHRLDYNNPTLPRETFWHRKSRSSPGWCLVRPKSAKVLVLCAKELSVEIGHCWQISSIFLSQLRLDRKNMFL